MLKKARGFLPLVNDHSLRLPLVSFALALTVMLSASGVGVAKPTRHELYEPLRAANLGGAKNFFRGAEVSGSQHVSRYTPGTAVDGDHLHAENYWGAEGVPVYLTIKLDLYQGKPRPLNVICLWLSWEHERAYQYVIQGSLNRKNWKVLVDQRKNTTPATPRGRFFTFPKQRVRFVRVTFTNQTYQGGQSGCIVEIEGYFAKPKAIDTRLRWTEVPPGLNGSVASIDRRYDRWKVPELARSMQWSGVAWRGERVSAQILLWMAEKLRRMHMTPTSLTDEQGREIPASCVRAQFVRYVLGDGKLRADVLDNKPFIGMVPRRTVRPVWVSIDVPADTPPGLYQGHLNAKAQGGLSLSFELNLEVLPQVLADPSEWSFHLDLWQNPWSVARYHHVKRWSEEHWLLLKPVLKMLADAGQKCITTTIIERPWRGQTYDAFGSMIGWYLQKDGSWRFDYTLFDQYVELCDSCGISKQINCYSMVPWHNRFAYRDEGTDTYQVLEASPETKAYKDHWRPFLVDFEKHLRERGWQDRTVIAMDERPLGPMKDVIAFIGKHAPSLKIALAGKYQPELKYDIHDYCFSLFHPVEPAAIAERTDRGLPTTFYVCCNPLKPNTFLKSPPAESTWMGWHAVAQGYTGFLRWAYNSWVKDPLFDTSHVTWTAGDCFLVYPGPRSSIRFERLRDGIEDYEKIQTLRKMLQSSVDAQAKECLQALEKMLAPFSFDAQAEVDYTDVVCKGKAELDKLSRNAAKFMPN